MRTMGSLALCTLCALFLLLHSVEGSNSTAIDTTPKYTGWLKGPAERGTMTILWSCLTTVFACTWTILHLNVPSVHDRTSTKLWRKIKWMIITVIFPEFIFAKAVCELQMAIEDLHELKKQEAAFGWDVEYGRGCRLLYWLFHFRMTSSSLPLPAVAASEIKKVDIAAMRRRAKGRNPTKKWTLTHSYFANMGGLVVPRAQDYYSTDTPITAHALARCCVPNKHCPLDDVYLTREEILDKSKADNLLKTVAALQILWLIVSVITRKAYSLPISLLEVCTVAFATLAVATYVANLAKPKDVDIPIPTFRESLHEDVFHLNGESFFARTVKPTETGTYSTLNPRIKNDKLRLQSHGTQYVTLTYALAVSTMCFGAIHCGAWQSYFPSEVERRLWQVASVLSTTLPLINLLVASTSNLMLGRQAQKITATMNSLMKPFEVGPVHPGVVPRKLAWNDGKLWVEEYDGPIVGYRTSEFSLFKCIASLLEIVKGVGKGEASRRWCDKYLGLWTCLHEHDSYFAYELDNTPVDISRFRPCYGQIERSDILENTILQIIETINNSHRTTKKICEEWWDLRRGVHFISVLFTYLLGLSYATSRLMLLALAFAAFRKQDERLYIDTWARFLPSIG